MNNSYDFSYQTREINTNRKVIYEKHAPEGCTIAYFYENQVPSQTEYQSTYNFYNTNYKSLQENITQQSQQTQQSQRRTYKNLFRRTVRTPDNAGRFVTRAQRSQKYIKAKKLFNEKKYDQYNATYTRSLKRNCSTDNHLLYYSTYTGHNRTYTPDTKLVKSSYTRTSKRIPRPIIKNVYTSTYSGLRRTYTPDNTNIYNATFTGFRRNKYNQLSKTYAVDNGVCREVNSTYNLRRVNPNYKSYQYKKVDAVILRDKSDNALREVKKEVCQTDENVQCCLDKVVEKPQLKKYKVKVVKIKKKVVVDENEVKEVKVVRDAVISNKQPKLLSQNEYEKLKESNDNAEYLNTEEGTNKKNAFISTEKKTKKIYHSSNKYGSDEKDSSNKKVLYNEEERNDEENEEEDEDALKKYNLHTTKKTTTVSKSMKAANENDEEANEENENEENENNGNENDGNEGYYKELVTQISDGAKGKVYKKVQKVQKIHKSQKKTKSKDINEENDGEGGDGGKYYKKVVEKTTTQTVDSSGKKSKPKKNS